MPRRADELAGFGSRFGQACTVRFAEIVSSRFCRAFQCMQFSVFEDIVLL